MFSRTCLALLLLPVTGLGQTPADPLSARLEALADPVVTQHMTEKGIPGLSVAIVHASQLVFAKGYGLASVEFDLPASPETVYPISSVSRMFAGLASVRLASRGALDLDASISAYLDDVPEDKSGITVRHLLQHTHGLEDFYGSDEYSEETGLAIDESTVDEVVAWSLGRPLRFAPGSDWAYGVVGYVALGYILETVSDKSYVDLVGEEVLTPLAIRGDFGGSERVVRGRNPVLYEMVDGELTGHVVEFPEMAWPAGGLNMSVIEMARLFAALDDDWFIGAEGKEALWANADFAGGRKSNYGLGWFSYLTSQGRWVVGHEGGGASWVVFYPDHQLAVIALSNLSGARADSLPYEIARAAFDDGLFPAQ